MGSGSSKRKVPTVMMGFRRERTEMKPSADDAKQQTETEVPEENKHIPETHAVPGESDEEDETDFVRTIDACNNSTWPIYGLAKFPYNINAHAGGCCGLLLYSCSYGGKGEETTAAGVLVGSGFDCNHRLQNMFYKDNQGHFGVEIHYLEDEYGTFVMKNLFGHNHMRILTNDSKYGNLRNGVYVESKGNSPKTTLPLNVNGNWNGEMGGGVSMVLCSGTDGDQHLNAVYMIRSGFKDDKYKAKVVSGEDKFTFDLEGEILAVTGPAGSRYALFHNRSNLEIFPKQHAFVAQLQTADGSKPMTLLEKVPQHVSVIVLCSNSNGTEDSTASAIYHIAVGNGKVTNTANVASVHGLNYTKSDLWTFEIKQGCLEVVGATGPCKYGIMTNILATKSDLKKSIKQSSCIATGEATKTIGKATITNDEVTGEVNKMADISIKLNQKIVRTIPGTELKKQDGVYKFIHTWSTEEKSVGLHLVRVHAVRKHVNLGNDVYLELENSPQFLTYQKPGVVYAVNAGSQAYQAMNDVVYSSEFSQYASYDSSFKKGYAWKCLGTIKTNASLPASMVGSDDEFLYANVRVSHGEGDFGQLTHYQVNDLPNGNYIFRLHTSNVVQDMTVNGVNAAKQIKITKKEESDSSYYCYTADVDITVTNGQFDLKARALDKSFRHTEKICAFALLDKKSYEEKVPSEDRRLEELAEKRRLADTIVPLQTTITRKALTIVGWSPNLLQNASAESGDLTQWNTGGPFHVAAGGHGTENCIVTSYNWCKKYQEVNLTNHFSTEYLDTAPDIQALEWYREGACGGGFYRMIVTLLNEEGETIIKHDTGEIGTIYAETKWQEASHIFKDYGPGVRMVGFTTSGKDDKFWQGFFGTRMSGAELRVKRQTEANKDDKYCDLDLQGMMEEGKSMTEKIVSSVLADNIDLLKDFVEDDTTVQESTVKAHKAKQVIQKRRVQRKKREIRVFVSSTFRDFQKEREEIIKKAFREINRLCSSRGVFFTYVDLRWGITSEQTNDGKTIAICLQEIERCRPYFICMMGDRFGWCQREEKKDEVLNMTYDYAINNYQNLKWIEDYRFDSSVTELEVLHGVLNAQSDEDLEKCFIYMRDTIKEGDLPEAEYKRMVSESPWHHERQEALKLKVNNRACLNIRKFKSATEVAQLITEDLEACIDKDFPIGTELTKLELQREAHQAFASARCRVYIGRQEYFDTINESRSNGINAPFVLMGESGSGKSALVANWAKRVEDAEPKSFMFVHFIGSSAESASYIKLLRRLFEELKEFFGIELQVPTSDAHLTNDVGKWLRIASSLAKSPTKIVIVFDALNQLDDGAGQNGNEHDLLWIPKNLPSNVFMLLSTLPGRAMDVCIEQAWPSMKVEPLDESQKAQIITDYLEGIYGKTLTQEQKDMIVNAKQTSNALYLKSLLDEVRMYGLFRTLSDKIRDYLTAASPGDLFAKILERLEEDFEKGENSRQSLVRDATTALWCSNRGMSEMELVEYLDVMSATWSPFYLSLFENLINRDGILNFFHDHLRQAVEKKYLSTDADKKACYLKLADFFEGREMSNRKVEELPTLLMKAGESDRLKATISDLDFFIRMEKDEDGHFELVKSWRSIGDFSQVVEAYNNKLANVSPQDIMDRHEYYIELYGLLGTFFKSLGLMEAAEEKYLVLLQNLERFYNVSHGTIVYSAMNHSCRYQCKHPEVIKTLKELGSVYYQLGKYDKAVKYYKDAINRVTKQDEVDMYAQKVQLCEGLVGLASVYIEQKNMAAAKPLMSRALQLATDSVGMSHPYTAAIFTKIGQLSYKQGQTEQALRYYMQDLKATRGEVGTNHPRIANVLNEIALVYDDWNDDRARELYEAALAIILNTYGANYIGTAVIRYNLGAFYFGSNYFAKAKYQFEEAYRVWGTFLGEQHPDTIVAKTALESVS